MVLANIFLMPMHFSPNFRPVPNCRKFRFEKSQKIKSENLFKGSGFVYA